MASFNSSLSEHSQSLKKVLLKILYFSFGVFSLLVISAFLVVVQLPIYLYRQLVTKVLAPFFRPKIGNAVIANAQFMATEFLDKNTKKPSRYMLLLTVVHNGTLMITELRELILKRWIEAKDVQDGTLYYPEFRQYIESWMGFMFWKQDEGFDLNNHVILHDLNKNMQHEGSEAYLDRLYEKFLNESFVRCRSPWEVHLIQNYRSSEGEDKEVTTILCRMHHVFGDGTALSHTLIEVLLGCKLENAHMQMSRVEPKRPCSIVLRNSLLLPFKLLYEFGYAVSIACTKDQIWKRQKIVISDMETGGLFESTGKAICAKSHLIPVAKLKAIKNRFGVSFSSVLLSSLAASLSKNFQANIPVIQKTKMRLCMMLPIPTSVHAKGLTLNTYCTVFYVDSHPQTDSVERLLDTERRVIKSAGSLVPNVILAFQKTFSGSLAIPFARVVDSSQCFSVGTSIFRGPEKPLGLDNKREIILMETVLGPFSDVQVLTFSYNGNMKVALTTNDDILNKFQLEELLKDLYEEIETLYKMAQGE